MVRKIKSKNRNSKYNQNIILGYLPEINLGIVCPIANERDTAELFVKDVLAECQTFEFKSVKFFAIFDRACRDGTFDIMLDISNDINELKVIFAPENHTVVDAYMRGYQEALNAGCNWILEIDAGYSHRPSDIPKFFETMIKGFDCVFGSRFCSGGTFTASPRTRYLISRWGSILSNFLLGTNLSDMTSGFQLFNNTTLEKILSKGIFSHGPFFQTEIRAHAHQFRITEVPIHYRTGSHINDAKVLCDALINLWRLFCLRLSNDL